MDKLNSIFGGAKDLGGPAADPVPVTDQQLAGTLQFQIGFQTAVQLATALFADEGFGLGRFPKCLELAIELLVDAQTDYPGIVHSAVLRRQAADARAADAAAAHDGAA